MWSAAFDEALRELVGVAHTHLRNALDYALTIPAGQPGIRLFCLWSLGFAILTLRQLARHPGFCSAEEVKISRLSVAATMFSTRLLVRHQRPLRLLFEKAARRVPLAPVTSADEPALLPQQISAG